MDNVSVGFKRFEIKRKSFLGRCEFFDYLLFSYAAFYLILL